MMLKIGTIFLYNIKVMNKTIEIAKKYKKQIILGPLFKIIEVIFELMMPLLMKYIIDTGYNEAVLTQDYTKIIVPGCLIILLCILGFCSTLVCQYFASIASQGYGTDLRNLIFEKVNKLSLREIELFGKGNIYNLISNDVNKMQTAIAMIIRLVVRAPALVIGSLIMSIIISPKASLIFLGVTVILSLLILFIFKFSSKQILKVQEKMDNITSLNNDDLNGIRVIKGFNHEEYEINKFKKVTNEYFKESKKNTLLNALVNPLTFLVIDIACAGVILLGKVEVSNSSLSTGDLISLIAYLNQILLALIVICNLVVIFTRAFASKKRIDNFINTESSIKENGEETKEINVNDSIIEFKNASFTYNIGENNILNDLNFDIKKGETVGIIGSTGSGKSTLIKLLLRFFDTTTGEILYKGINIKNYSLSSLRKEIAFVPQKVSLVSGSIKENLMMGKKDATENDIEVALKRAEASEFVSKLPNKEETILVEGGKNLSGGQRQRIAIARALIKDSEVVVLDDSTSALDYLTDKNVRHNIKEIEGVTTIMVSQRATSLMNCDKIIVLSKGKIESIGNSDYLLENSKVFKEIYESQKGAK